MKEVVEQAQELWDNRLGHRPDNPCWFAPKFFWENLGKALKQACTEGYDGSTVTYDNPPTSCNVSNCPICNKKPPCPDCEGKGWFGGWRCEDCKGTGREEKM